MPRTGGVYSPPAGTKGVPNTTIQSVPYNTLIDDLTADANAARPITAGGTGSTSASAARTALGVAIGTNVQAYDAGLQSISGLVTVADQMIYTTALDTYATTALTPFARTLLDDANASTALTTLGVSTFIKTLLDDADAAAAQSTLGLTIGTNVQAYDAGLASIAGLTTAADRMIYTTASDTYAVTALTAFGRTLIDDADAPAARSTLGLVIGTNVQAYDAGLASIAGLTTAADRMIYTTALNTYAVTTLTSFARTLLDDADATAARATLGVTIGTQVLAYDAGLSAIAGLAVTDSNFIVGNGTTWVAESGATARASMGAAASAQQVIAGNGLTGGGTLAADRTLTVGQGTGISVATTTVSVDATVWRDGNQPTAAQIGSLYAGNAQGAIGTYAFALKKTAGTINPGSTVAGTDLYWSNSANSAVLGIDAGTWRAMGVITNGSASLALRIS